MNIVIKGAVATIAAAGLALGTPAVSSATETGYLDNLNRGGIQVNNSATALQAGYLICVDLANGYTIVQEATVAKRVFPTLTDYQAGWLVGSAIRELC